MRHTILGISAFYHDSAAALVVDGHIMAAAQEERFTRVKHDASFPIHAIRYVLAEASVDISQIDSVVFYDKPLLKFERLLETYHAIAPRGLKGFLTAIPVWIKDKLFLRRLIRRELATLGNFTAPIQFTEHHLSHAASAFYPSPFEEAAILTIDGVGEWATTTISHGRGNQIRMLRELHFPHSVGLLYSAFTYYLGFKVNGGEYKLMGLAPYGNPTAEQTQNFQRKILDELISLKEDGSIQLNLDYFKFLGGLRMADDRR
ncbi:MAG: carbamoyltransferase N-terminal domain-containing protein, partial [Tunicatimonas sp.]|uniref:carbamoyltransferase N-terminal domain-containing protein n=1 Tax=Tunicatimonas sp. TaxID=1940096 RepID=UPI003C712445